MLVEQVFAGFAQEVLDQLILTGARDLGPSSNRIGVGSAGRTQELVICARDEMASQKLAFVQAKLTLTIVARHTFSFGRRGADADLRRQHSTQKLCGSEPFPN